jgi:hypothetical protein
MHLIIKEVQKIITLGPLRNPNVDETYKEV